VRIGPNRLFIRNAGGFDSNEPDCDAGCRVAFEDDAARDVNLSGLGKSRGGQ
jgi:hypothetical protein